MTHIVLPRLSVLLAQFFAAVRQLCPDNAQLPLPVVTQI